MSESIASGGDSQRKLSLLERTLKRRKMVGSAGKYIDTRFIVPTSNMVESFFSRAGYALNDRRRSLLPANLEAQMFLLANTGFWNVEDVRKVV